MDDNTKTNCPHCGAANENVSSFCVVCGKALPTVAQSTPRLVTGSIPTSNAARQLVSEELKKNLKEAKGALLAVAILQTIVGLVFLAAARANSDIQPIVAYVVLAIGLIYWGLFAWARSNPLPAAIAGLVLYVTMNLVNAIADPSQVTRGIVVKILVVLALVRAIQAGIKYKRLLPQLQSA